MNEIKKKKKKIILKNKASAKPNKVVKTRLQNQVGDHYLMGDSCNAVDLSFFLIKKILRSCIFFKKKNKIQDYDH
jgi:hypothetical protein